MAKDKNDRPLSALQRSVLEAIGRNTSFGNMEDPAKELYPALWAWMTETDAGKDRVMTPARLNLAAMNDCFNVQLMHSDLGRSVECQVLHLGDCFRTINEQLLSPNPGIKVWTKKQVKLRKRLTE